MPNPRVALIQVFHNEKSADLLLRSLESVSRLTLKPSRILLMDNGTSAETSERILRHSPLSPELIRLGENLGFAAACNAGIRAVLEKNDCEFLWFLNPDTRTRPDALNWMVGTLMTHPRAAAVGSRQLNPDGTIEYDGGIRLPSGLFTHRIDGGSSLPSPCDWITGASLLARTSVFQQGFFMEERYFLYSDDTDLALRLKRSGFELWHEPRALVEHATSATIAFESPMREYYFTRAKFLLARFHNDSKQFLAEQRVLFRKTGASYLKRPGPIHLLRQILDWRYGWSERAMWVGYLDALRGRTGRVDYPFFNYWDEARPFLPFRFRLR